MPDDINVSMIGDAVVEAIQQSVKTELIQVDGRTFVTRPVYGPPTEPSPNALTVHTLSGLVDYVNNIASIDPDFAKAVKCVHVASPHLVNVYGELMGREYDRHIYVQAVFEPVKNSIGFQLGSFCDPEIFTIALQSLFEDAGDVARVLRLVGNLRSESVKTLEDDGVTQVVGTRAGVVLKTEAQVPNPVHLAPFRTFNEVEQPLSSYIFRVRENGEKLPLCALFCADGDAWKLAAIERIKNYLAEKITSVPIIA